MGAPGPAARRIVSALTISAPMVSGHTVCAPTITPGGNPKRAYGKRAYDSLRYPRGV
jgi:hypothetical protein